LIEALSALIPDKDPEHAMFEALRGELSAGGRQ
jgi:hypothetical protein